MKSCEPHLEQKHFWRFGDDWYSLMHSAPDVTMQRFGGNERVGGECRAMRLAAHRAVTMLGDSKRRPDFVANRAAETTAVERGVCHARYPFGRPKVSHRKYHM